MARDNKKQEFNAIVLLISYSFFMGIAIAFFFTNAISYFFEFNNSTILPYTYIYSGLLGLTLWWLYSQAEKFSGFSARLFAGLLFLAASVVWLVSVRGNLPNQPLSMFMMVWVGAFIFISKVSFWGMAGRMFDLSQGKRLFAIINTGEVFSNIIAFFSIPVLTNLKLITIQQLPLVSIASLGLCLVVVLLIVRQYHTKLKGGTQKRGRKQGPRLFALLKNRYNRYVFLLAAFPLFSFYFVDFVFFDRLNNEPQYGNNPESLALFMSFFMGTMAIAELLVRTLLYGRLLKFYKLIGGVLALPVLLGIAIIAALLANVAGLFGILFSIIALNKLLERVIGNGIHTPSFQLLYQPLSAIERPKLQSSVEGIPIALGSVAAGAVLLLLSKIAPGYTVWYTLVLLAVVVLWGRLTLRLYGDYKNKLQTKLLNEYPVLAPQSRSNRLMQLLYIAPETTHNSTKVNALLNTLSLDLIAPWKQMRGSQPEQTQPVIKPPTRTVLMLPGHEATKAAMLNKVGQGAGKINDEDIVTILLDDEDAQIRKLALSACTELYHEAHIPRVADMLTEPASSTLAAQVLIGYGDQSLDVLDTLFHRNRQNETVALTLVQIVSEINTEAATSFLLDKLSTSDFDIQLAIVEALAKKRRWIMADGQAQVVNMINQAIDNVLWVDASLIDLPDNLENIELLDALRVEKHLHMQAFWYLMQIRYKPDIIMSIQQTLTNEENIEGRIFSIELLNSTIPDGDSLKAKIIGLIEEEQAEVRLKKLAVYFPQEHMPIKQRLINIINHDYAASSLWTKASALNLLGKYFEHEPPLELVASIYHWHPIIYETAFYRLQKYHGVNLSEHYDCVEPQKVQSLKQIFASEMVNYKLEYVKVNILKGLPEFEKVAEHHLSKLSTHAKVVRLKKGDEVQLLTEQPYAYIFFSGEVVVYQGDTATAQISSDEKIWVHGIHFEASATKLVANNKTILMQIEKFQFLNHIFTYAELTAPILEAMGLATNTPANA